MRPGEPTFAIRRATADDAPAVAAQYAALHDDQWEGAGEAPRGGHEPDWLGEVLQALASATTTLFVAEAGGVVIGTARVELAERPYFRIADIRRVYVRPEWRRRGVASALMAAAEDAARAGGAREVRLSVVAENSSALDFYAKRGFDHFAIRLRKRIRD